MTDVGPEERRRRRRLLLLVSPGVAWIVATYVLPTLLILLYSFLTPRLGGGVEWRVSLDAYRTLTAADARASLYNPYVTVLARSIVWAGFTTAICFVLALPVALYIHGRRTALGRYALLIAVMIPFWTSMLVRTYALRYLLANTGPLNGVLRWLGFEPITLLNSRIAVVIGLVYTALPFMILPLYAAVARVDPRVLEAGRDLGANGPQTFVRVFLPLVSAGTVVGCVLVFVLSASQYIVPTLLGGGKVNMIANLIELQFGDAFNWPLGSGIAIFFSALTLLGLSVVTAHRREAQLL
ncbi:MAG: ABC transporter permease [Actinomycetota bacterium]|nr:MAG: ABC transporter permease [Actinomycetota bacterium]